MSDEAVLDKAGILLDGETGKPIIDESLEGEAALYMRAKLHVKGGLERFSDGMTADAIAAIYDAISSAMQRYLILDDVRCDIQKEDGDH